MTVRFFVLLGSCFREMLLLYWADREQFPGAYTPVGQVDVSCRLHLCVELNKADFKCFWTFVGCLLISTLGLWKPPSIYCMLLCGQCDLSRGRVRMITLRTACQRADSAFLKDISAGETISTLLPGRQNSVACLSCHIGSVSLGMKTQRCCVSAALSSASASSVCHSVRALSLHCSLCKPCLPRNCCTPSSSLCWEVPIPRDALLV